MKRTADSKSFKTVLGSFAKKLIPCSASRGPVIAALGAFGFTLAVVLANMNSGRTGSPEDFEAGKVADRDVIAAHAVTYEDKKATRLKLEAQERQVPAVFYFSRKASADIRSAWKQFASLASGADGGALSLESFIGSVEEKYPGSYPAAMLEEFYSINDRDDIIREASLLLDELLGKGIYLIPSGGLENLNQNIVELVRESDSRVEREWVQLSALITEDKAGEAIERKIAAGSYSAVFAGIGRELLEPVIAENVFYSPEETGRRIMETRSKIEPVVKYIERGKRVIKKGFIVSGEEMAELEALSISRPGGDARDIISQIMFLLFIFIAIFYYCAHGTMGRMLSGPEAYLVSVLAAVYLTGTVLARNVSFAADSMYVSVIMPTALVIMIPSILINLRLALFLSAILPLGAFFIGSFDLHSYIFALMSGITSAFVLHGAQKRMDLLKAGLIVAAVNCAAMIAGLLGRRVEAAIYPGALFWAAFNGMASGMLVLGFLPLLEHILNAATPFRLIELSDLNTPVLRRLFTTAPGTYSHSIMVANLAEAACQDIGANALLARVGAYYHDLGKMENPDYFVENQTDHNKHDDMSPRLSATVIRSHVKLGLEKGRQLGLPAKVMEIISEHHGDSVITWFYNKALKQEGQVKEEDFSYPGNPPQSRESAVVMLADTTEAAVRTLDKPTVARLEKFIQELFNAKVEHGQLSRADLTFKDMETIKNAFVRVLVGYYHSRIEYPKFAKDGSALPAANGQSGEAEK